MVTALFVSAFAACSSNEGGLEVPDGGTGGKPASGGGTKATSGGNGTGASSGKPQVGGAGPTDGGAAGAGNDAGANPGGASNAGGETAVDAGAGGAPSEGGTNSGPVEACVFHTTAPDPSEVPPPPPSGGGAGGAGGSAAVGDAGSGGAPPEYDVSLQLSPFVGPYLGDRGGKALYIYGADMPGDCNTPPISTCFDDCLVSWPVFDAGVRDLAPELDDAAFGRIEREDGGFQTTYLGWPLYYFKSDTGPGMLTGQGRGRIWFAAETVLPNVMIMRAPEAAGGMRYLGDDRGRTLYVFADDVAGTSTSAPVSRCTDSCLEDFPPFARPAVLPVSSLEPADLTVFVREDGSSQIAYRGLPLYTSVADTKSGDLNGAEIDGWSMITL
jgi:predicted lipoprotein with Yx(FWY)xxD motif